MGGDDKAAPAGTSTLLRALAGDDEVAHFLSDSADVAAMLRFEAELAGSQADAGLVPAEAAARIADVCQSFAPDWPDLARSIAVDGVIVPALVRQLRNAVGQPHALLVHLGATSQDAIDTSLVLRLAAVLDLLENRLRRLVARLDELASEQGATVIMAHTRMQRAMQFTAADKIGTWSAPLRRHLERLSQMGPRLLVVQFGGPVGTRDGLAGKGNEVAAGLAKRLGLAAAPSWHSQRDRLLELGSWLSLVTGSLGKVGADISLMAQNDVGEVVLASGGGSSSLPHKSNPVAAELLVALARVNAGLIGALHQALVHENERSGAAWTVEWLILPQMLEATAGSVRRALDLVSGITFRASRGGA
jgi:3-carboxy-cis,cis-muconate cycloisomerase